MRRFAPGFCTYFGTAVGWRWICSCFSLLAFVFDSGMLRVEICLPAFFCFCLTCAGAARRLRDLRWRALGPRHKSRQRVQRCLAHSSYRRLGHYSSPSLGSGLQGRADATSRTCVVNERQPFAKQVPTEQEHEAGSVRRFAPGVCTCFGTAVGWR